MHLAVALMIYFISVARGSGLGWKIELQMLIWKVVLAQILGWIAQHSLFNPPRYLVKNWTKEN